MLKLLFFLSLLMSIAFAQNCLSSSQCVANQRQGIQSACGSASQNQACLCQQYQSIISNCLRGCSDSGSIQLLQSMQTENMSYCNAAASGMPYANNFFATPVFDSPSLIINNGPTGIAIPVQSNNFGSPATFSLANSPIKISNAYYSNPNALLVGTIILVLSFF